MIFWDMVWKGLFYLAIGGSLLYAHISLCLPNLLLVFIIPWFIFGIICYTVVYFGIFRAKN
jgi:hypothetical protein